MLRRANEEFRGAPHFFNPLWRAFGTAFSDYLGGPNGDLPCCREGLYVPRMDGVPGFVSEREIIRHVERGERNLLIIVGPTGIGKTTLLFQAFKTLRFGWSHQPVIWVDVMRDLDVHEGSTLREAVYKRLNSQMTAWIAQGQQTPATSEWHGFLCGHDATEIVAYECAKSSFATGEQGRAGTWEEFVKLENRINAQRFEYVRLQAEFAASVRLGRPLFVIDNCDQLDRRLIGELVQMGRFLAGGSASAADGVSPQVILALRDATFHDLDRGARAHCIGKIGPPDINEVLARRLHSFVEERWKGPLVLEPLVAASGIKVALDSLRGALCRVADRGEPGVAELQKSLQSTDDEALRTGIVRLIHALGTEIMVGQFGGRSIAEMVHVLTNGNTRLALNAVRSLLASGHLEVVGLALKALQHVPVVGDIQLNKIVRSLVLGIRPVFQKTGSWLVNLLSDGVADRIGLMIRLRTLLAVRALGACEEGIAVSRIANALKELLGYDVFRVEQSLRVLYLFCLVESSTATLNGEDLRTRKVKVSGAGEEYITRLLESFNYTQYMCQDVFVPVIKLVPCLGGGEARLRRVKRVLGVCSFMREVECEELGRVIAQEKVGECASLFGGEPLFRRVVRSVRTEWDRLADPHDASGAWAGLFAELRSLDEPTPFELAMDQ